MAEAWKTVRAFISSTFRDMHAERDHLVRFVFPKLREELLPRRIHLVDVDLRWGVTAEQDSLQVCREIIDECRPRFLCMLGGRYGWVPPGREQSITAAEVQHGVLDRLGTHGHAFFYFRDPQATAAMVEETPGEYREPEGTPNAQKLAALVIAYAGWTLSPSVAAFAQARGVRVISRPLSTLPSAMVQRLRTSYYLSTPLKKHPQREKIVRRAVE